FAGLGLDVRAVGFGHLPGKVDHAVVDAGFGHAWAGVDALDHLGHLGEREAARYASGRLRGSTAGCGPSAPRRTCRATGASPFPPQRNLHTAIACLPRAARDHRRSPTTEQHDGDLSRSFATTVARRVG